MDNIGNQRTREQVEHRVETVEQTEYQCANCSQWFEDTSEIVPVALDAKAETSVGASQMAALCVDCSEAIFDYTGPSDARFSTLTTRVGEGTPDIDLPAVGITVTVAAIVGWVGLQVMNTVSGELSDAQFEQASQELATSTGATLFLGLVGVFMIFVMLSVVVLYLRAGTRI